MKKVAGLWLIGMAVGAAYAGPQAFDYKDPKGVNNIVFQLDAPVESINGTANGVSGSVQFDPDQPEALSGWIAIATASMHVPNPVMKDHLLSEGWMHAEKYPEMRFEVAGVDQVKTTERGIEAQVRGRLTVRGVTLDLEVPVRINYLKDKLSSRSPQLKGDLLVIRSAFSIKRSDFDINPKAPQDKVSDEIQITLSVAGAARH